MVNPPASNGCYSTYDRPTTTLTESHYTVPGCRCCRHVNRPPCIKPESCIAAMRAHKSYFALIFVPYLFLIVIFHTQLQLFDAGGHSRVLEEEGAFRGQGQAAGQEPGAEGTYRFRDLMLKHNGGSMMHDGKAANGRSKMDHNAGGIQNDTIPKFIAPQSVIPSTPNHIEQLLQLDKATQALLTSEKRMYESRWNSSSQWNSAYPMSSHCRTAPVVTDVPYVTFQPLLNHWVYTAYYDDRDPDPPQVRVILLFKKLERPGIFCHFPKIPRPKQESAFISVMPGYYEMCENHAKDYGGWILSCQVPSELLEPPCEVVVSVHSTYQPNSKKNIRVPVFTTSSKVKQEFGVCIPPIFGYIPSTTLVEFIEMTKLLGASHLVFYAHQASREIQKVLRFYDQQGTLTVINWDLPVTEKQIWYHGQLLAINDCLYRNMHRFSYLAFNDLDEFIVPHSPGAHNWTQMIKDIHKVAAFEKSNPDLHCGYSFQSAFFDPLSSGSRVLYDLESDLRTKSLSTVRTKTMVRPERMFELGIHHISRPMEDKFEAYYVMPSEAYIHHYRKCVTDFDPKMNCQVYARDETLSPYIPSLRHNVHQALWTLKEREKINAWRT